MMKSLSQAIQTHAQAFESEKDLDSLLEAIGDAKIVMLGEASHGTSEFYTVRAALTKRLIEEKGFTNIAVEGDWPACRQVNRYIKGYDNKQQSSRQVLEAFQRWPTWMWANEEVADLVDWLKMYNQNKGKAEKVGFYGIDVYSLWESMEDIIEFLEKDEPEGADLELAKKAFSCFEPFNRQPEQYAMSSAFFSQTCIDKVAELLTSIRTHEDKYKDEQESDLNLKINALVTQNAEDYYRTMVQHNDQSWNIRDEHMVEALNEIRRYYGEDSKVIVWEHNTHIGDASATSMRDEGMTNVGEIVRNQHKKEDVYAVGFGTHHGTVVASGEWGVEFEEKEVPPARKDSWEDLLHQSGAYNKFLLFNPENRGLFDEWLGHRAIGVVYNPAYEAYGNYVPSRISKRYDAFVFINETKALSPLTLAGISD